VKSALPPLKPLTEEHLQGTLSALESIIVGLSSEPEPAAPAASAGAEGSAGAEPGEAGPAAAGKLISIDGVAHDLRSSLSAIILYVEHLLRGEEGPLTDDQARVLHIVTGNTQRLANFINNLLDLHRVSRGRLEIELSPQPLEQIVADVVELYRPIAEKRNVKLTTVLPPQTPRVMGNAAKLEQVVTNLLSNAMKYAPSGGNVSVAISPGPDRWVQVIVDDDGPGVPEAERAALLRGYTELDETARAGLVRGTGLGLLISREILVAHGGGLSIESSPGGGAAVRFFVTAAPAA
jgi:signal transduction histidine kinase